MTGSGQMDKNKDMEHGKIMIMNSIVDNGLKISQMDSENMFGKMVMFMKENGKRA